jgi:hypothetical protein
MARPFKQGLDYYSELVNEFEKDSYLLDVKEDFGPLGESVLFRIRDWVLAEGYYLESTQQTGNVNISCYKNSSGISIRINQWKTTPSITINNEGAKTYETDLDGTKVLVIEDKINIVVFSMDTNVFSIEGKIGVSELLKVAESIIR